MTSRSQLPMALTLGNALTRGRCDMPWQVPTCHQKESFSQFTPPNRRSRKTGSTCHAPATHAHSGSDRGNSVRGTPRRQHPLPARSPRHLAPSSTRGRRTCRRSERVSQPPAILIRSPMLRCRLTSLAASSRAPIALAKACPATAACPGPRCGLTEEWAAGHPGQSSRDQAHGADQRVAGTDFVLAFNRAREIQGTQRPGQTGGPPLDQRELVDLALAVHSGLSS